MAKEPPKWSITKAIAEAQKEGIDLSRPTVIKMCREFAIGYQPTGRGGKWAVRPERFMKIVRGKQYDWDI